MKSTLEKKTIEHQTRNIYHQVYAKRRKNWRRNMYIANSRTNQKTNYYWSWRIDYQYNNLIQKLRDDVKRRRFTTHQYRHYDRSTTTTSHDRLERHRKLYNTTIDEVSKITHAREKNRIFAIYDKWLSIEWWVNYERSHCSDEHCREREANYFRRYKNDHLWHRSRHIMTAKAELAD